MGMGYRLPSLSRPWSWFQWSGYTRYDDNDDDFRWLFFRSRIWIIEVFASFLYLFIVIKSLHNRYFCCLIMTLLSSIWIIEVPTSSFLVAIWIINMSDMNQVRNYSPLPSINNSIKVSSILCFLHADMSGVHYILNLKLISHSFTSRKFFFLFPLELLLRLQSW